MLNVRYGDKTNSIQTEKGKKYIFDENLNIKDGGM
jgi:hypothetical protein